MTRRAAEPLLFKKNWSSRNNLNRTSQRRSDTRSHSFRLVISVLLETGRKWRRWILVNLFTHQALLPKAATCFLFFLSLSFFLKAFQSDKTPVLPPAGRMMLLSRQPQDGPPDTHAHTHTFYVQWCHPRRGDRRGPRQDTKIHTVNTHTLIRRRGGQQCVLGGGGGGGLRWSRGGQEELIRGSRDGELGEQRGDVGPSLRADRTDSRLVPQVLFFNSH